MVAVDVAATDTSSSGTGDEMNGSANLHMHANNTPASAVMSPTETETGLVAHKNKNKTARINIVAVFFATGALGTVEVFLAALAELSLVFTAVGAWVVVFFATGVFLGAVEVFLVALAGLSLVFTAVGAWVFLVALAGFSLVSVRAFAGLLLLVTLLTPFLARRFRPGGARDALPVARIGNQQLCRQPHSLTAHVDTQSNRTPNISHIAGVLCGCGAQLKMSADSRFRCFQV